MSAMGSNFDLVPELARRPLQVIQHAQGAYQTRRFDTSSKVHSCDCGVMILQAMSQM